MISEETTHRPKITEPMTMITDYLIALELVIYQDFHLHFFLSPLLLVQLQVGPLTVSQSIWVKIAINLHGH